MASTYWIKLYHEILDDPKMGTLPDRLYRRVIELFLLAGKIGEGGDIPDEMQISWILRIPADDLLLDLQQIESTGIIERTVTGWRVVNFSERQAPAPDAERKQRQREREKREQYHGSVTNVSRNVTQNQNTDTEPEPEAKTEPQPQPQQQLQAGTGGGSGGGPKEINQEVNEILISYGVGDPNRTKLATLPFVNPIMVRYHLDTAPKIGAAIYRIEHNWPYEPEYAEVSDDTT